MYVINSNFTIVKSIGDLSASRIGALKEALGSKFPEIIQPNEETLIFRRGVSALIISPDQIIYGTQGSVEEFKISDIADLLVATNEILGLSQKANAIAMRLEAIEDIQENALERSKSMLHEITDIFGANGVGYRFIIENDLYHGDINVEPFLKDNQKIFYGITLQSNSTELSSLTTSLETLFTFGTEKAQAAASKIFSL
ncbi:MULTISPECIES: hypothetical protein [Priestia]|uniref:hypothetical protein n=1 Tax=Priestia TaxID=2800373 RepID=UPI001C8D42AD|nr:MULTISPECIES: hypothetical protein [Priestia]MBX9988606.1 hypothetical protein [Priestia aryabhattai]MCY9017276.1 hypothetical protein [Priestia megaterium]